MGVVGVTMARLPTKGHYIDMGNNWIIYHTEIVRRRLLVDSGFKQYVSNVNLLAEEFSLPACSNCYKKLIINS